MFQAHRSSRELLLELLRFLLEHTFFLFNGKIYKQKKGTAMCTACAPTYANLFLAWWERTQVLIENMDNHISRILLWACIIDDVFILWMCPEENCEEFVVCLNVNNIGMYFTSKIQHDCIHFLDLTITRDACG